MKSAVLLTGALLALSGCLLPELPEQRLTGLRAERDLKLANLEAEQDDNLARIAAISRVPLDKYRAEPHGSCDSRNLWFAQYLLDVGGKSDIFEVTSLEASLRLDVADAAAERGCPEVARDIYREVIARYVGWGYTAQRQRAEIGLAELRADD